jgi:hypothetical protein
MTAKHPFGAALEPAKAAAQLSQDPAYDPEFSRVLQAMVMLNKSK